LITDPGTVTIIAPQTAAIMVTAPGSAINFVTPAPDVQDHIRAAAAGLCRMKPALTKPTLRRYSL
jgi:hypothetical protein